MAGFDSELYGRLLYALRHVRGYRKAEDLAAAMTAHGEQTSPRTVWAIERGEQEAKAGQIVVLQHLLVPEPGYFEQAYTHPILDEDHVHPHART